MVVNKDLKSFRAMNPKNSHYSKPFAVQEVNAMLSQKWKVVQVYIAVQVPE